MHILNASLLTPSHGNIELSHPKERAIIGSLFNSCYFIGENLSLLISEDALIP